MNIEQVRVDLESDLAWRQAEMRFLKNLGARAANEEEEKRYRRALVVMLYAHFEGFAKVALTEYAAQVNGAGLKCGEVVSAIAASTWANVFIDLEDFQNKSGKFSRQQDSDSRFNRLVRRVEFVEAFRGLEQAFARVTDVALDTESNLTSKVLRRMLFGLGLAPDSFSQYSGRVDRLIRQRNDVAHGAATDGLTPEQYRGIEEAAYEVLEGLRDLVVEALKSRSFSAQTAVAS